jgi:hypothetical protein
MGGGRSRERTQASRERTQGICVGGERPTFTPVMLSCTLSTCCAPVCLAGKPTCRALDL